LRLRTKDETPRMLDRPLATGNPTLQLRWRLLSQSGRFKFDKAKPLHSGEQSALGTFNFKSIVTKYGTELCSVLIVFTASNKTACYLKITPSA
jgi:hypothetical protein